jgi:25S rRNA (uracil2634-N3)-methyltransferase
MHEYEDDADEQLSGINKPRHSENNKGSQSMNENYQANRGGLITVTTKGGEPYDSWRVPTIARIVNHNQLQAQHYKEDSAGVPRSSWDKKFPKMQLLRRVPFFPDVYPGYSHRRTIGFKDGLSQDENQEITKSQAKTYLFCRAPEGYVDKSIGLSFGDLGEEQQAKAIRKKELKGNVNKPTTRKQVMKARTATSSGRKRR